MNNMEKRKPRICYVYTDWNMNKFRQDNKTYGGITYYRCAKPAQYLSEFYDIDLLGVHLKDWGTVEQTMKRLFTEYDLIYCKHIDNGKMASNFLACANYYQKPLLVDVDDNYLEITKANPAYDIYAPLKGGRYFLGTFMSMADHLTVSTQPLKETYSKYFTQFPDNPLITVLPNCNDVNDWPTKRKEWGDGKIRIGYQGGSGHKEDLEIVLEPIAEILFRHENVKFEIVGIVAKKDMKKITKKIQKYRKGVKANQIEFYGGTPAWDGYPAFINSFGWDIQIAPLLDQPFERCKSHIKWMEAAMVGCPIVASPVYPYIEPIQGINTIVDKETGLFARNSQEWIDNLELLITNGTIRKEIATNAYSYIRDNWQYSQHAWKWKQVIDSHLNLETRN